MSNQRDYIKVLRKLDERKLKPLVGDDQAKAMRFYDNLWAQFGLGPRKRKALAKHGPIPLSVTDFAWTADVRRAFYDHPYHKAFVRRMKKQQACSWGIFLLNAEPCDYKEGA